MAVGNTVKNIDDIGARVLPPEETWTLEEGTPFFHERFLVETAAQMVVSSFQVRIARGEPPPRSLMRSNKTRMSKVHAVINNENEAPVEDQPAAPNQETPEKAPEPVKVKPQRSAQTVTIQAAVCHAHTYLGAERLALELVPRCQNVKEQLYQTVAPMCSDIKSAPSVHSANIRYEVNRFLRSRLVSIDLAELLEYDIGEKDFSRRPGHVTDTSDEEDSEEDAEDSPRHGFRLSGNSSRSSRRPRGSFSMGKSSLHGSTNSESTSKQLFRTSLKGRMAFSSTVALPLPLPPGRCDDLGKPDIKEDKSSKNSNPPRCRPLQQDPDHKIELLTRNFEARFWRAMANGLGRSLFGQTSHRLVLRFEACAQDIFDRYEGELQLAVNSLMGWLPSWVSDSLFLSFGGLRAVAASQQTSRKYVMLHRCIRTLMHSSGRYIFVATPGWYLPIVSSLPGLGRREEVRHNFAHISLGLRPVWPTCCLGPEACIRVVDQLWGGMIKGQRAALELCAGVEPLGPWVLHETLASEGLLAEALRVIKQMAPLLEEAYLDMMNEGAFTPDGRPPVDSLAAKAFALDLVPRMTLIAHQKRREQVVQAKGARRFRGVSLGERLQSARLSVLDHNYWSSGVTAKDTETARRAASSSMSASSKADPAGSSAAAATGAGAGASAGTTSASFVMATTTTTKSTAEGELGEGLQEDLIRNGIFAPAKRRRHQPSGSTRGTMVTASAIADPSTVIAEAGSLLAGLHHDNRGLAAVSATKTGGARVREVIFAGRKPEVLAEEGDDPEELMCWPLGAGLAPGRIPIHDSPDLLPTAPPPNFDPIKEEELRESLAQAKRHLRHGWNRAELVRALGLGPSPPNLLEDNIVAAIDNNHRRRTRSEIRLREDPDKKVPTEKLSLSERWQLLQRQPSAQPGQTAAASRRTKSAPAAFRTQEWDVGDPHQNSAVALALQQEITRCLRAMSIESPLYLAWRHPRNSEDLINLYSRRLSLGVLLLFSALRSPLPAAADAPLLHFLGRGHFQEPSLIAARSVPTGHPAPATSSTASGGAPSPPGSAAFFHNKTASAISLNEGIDSIGVSVTTNGSLVNSNANMNTQRPNGNIALDSSANSNSVGDDGRPQGSGGVVGGGGGGGVFTSSGAAASGAGTGIFTGGGTSAGPGPGAGPVAGPGAGGGGVAARRISLADGVYTLGCLPIFATLPSETSAAASPTMTGYFRIGVPHAMLEPNVLRDILVSLPAATRPELQPSNSDSSCSTEKQEPKPSTSLDGGIGGSSRAESCPATWREGSLVILLTSAAAEEARDQQAWWQETNWMSSERCGLASLCCVFRFVLALEHLLIWNVTQEVPVKPPLGDFFPFIRDCGSQVEEAILWLDMAADRGKAPLLNGNPVRECQEDDDVVEGGNCATPLSRPANRQSIRLQDFARWISGLSPGRIIYSSHQSSTGDLYLRLDSVVVVFVFAYISSNGAGLESLDIARLYLDAVGRTTWWEPCKISVIVLANKLSTKFEPYLERSRCFRVGAGEGLPSYEDFEVQKGSEILICHENCLGALMGGTNEALATHQRLFETEVKSFTASAAKSRNTAQTFGRASAVGAARNAVRDWRAYRPKHPRQIVLDLHADLMKQLLAHAYNHTTALVHLSQTNFRDDPFASVPLHGKGSRDSTGELDEDDDHDDDDEEDIEAVEPIVESPRRSLISIQQRGSHFSLGRGSQGSSRASIPQMFEDSADETAAVERSIEKPAVVEKQCQIDLDNIDSSIVNPSVGPMSPPFCNVDEHEDLEAPPRCSNDHNNTTLAGYVARVDCRVASPTSSSENRRQCRKHRAVHPKRRHWQDAHRENRSSPNLNVNSIDFLGLGDWSRLDPLSSWSTAKADIA